MINDSEEGENFEKMITQTNLQGPESNSLYVFKDVSPQSNIAAPSFEDDEFDIPQVNNFSILRLYASKIFDNRKIVDYH